AGLYGQHHPHELDRHSWARRVHRDERVGVPEHDWVTVCIGGNEKFAPPDYFAGAAGGLGAGAPGAGCAGALHCLDCASVLADESAVLKPAQLSGRVGMGSPGSCTQMRPRVSPPWPLLEMQYESSVVNPSVQTPKAEPMRSGRVLLPASQP